MEWLIDLHHRDTKVISSSRKKLKKVVRPKETPSQAGTIAQTRKKVDGVLRRSVHSLQKSDETTK